MRESDVTSIRELLDTVCRERRFLATLEAPPLERALAFVANNIQRGYPQIVAVEADRVIGWCDAVPGDATSGNAHIGRLGMGVAREHRGQGLGRALLTATIARCQEIGMEKIELTVYSSNEPAIALYRGMGFTEEGRRKRGRLVDGIYDDVILMALML